MEKENLFQQLEDAVNVIKDKIEALEKKIESLDDLKKKVETKQASMESMKTNLTNIIDNAYDCGSSLNFMKAFRENAKEIITGRNYQQVVNADTSILQEIVKLRSEWIQEILDLEDEILKVKNSFTEQDEESVAIAVKIDQIHWYL